MKVFHLFAVFPAGLNAAGFNQVRHYDWHIFAKSPVNALSKIAGRRVLKNPDLPFDPLAGDELYHEVNDAFEVWGHSVDYSNNPVLSSPGTRRNQLVLLADHLRWAETQRVYQLARRATTTLQAHFDAEFDRYFKARHPGFYPAENSIESPAEGLLSNLPA